MTANVKDRQVSSHRDTGGTVVASQDTCDVVAAHERGVWLRRAITVAALLVLVGLAFWLATNERFEWPVVAQYFFAPAVMRGIGMTLILTVVCTVLGLIGGMVLAVMKMSPVPVLRYISTALVWFFRAVPMLVQLIFWFNISYLVPRLIIGVPFGPEFFSWSMNDLVNAFTAAVIGLAIHEAVYLSEIIRSGLMSVDSGQRDAAKALGYTGRQTLFVIVAPQALRVILPPTGSQVISLLKGTSLVSVIGMTDLLHAVQVIYSRTFEVIPLLMVASIWYLILVGLLSFGQSKLEQRLGRGLTRAPAIPARRRKRTGKANV